MKYLKCWEKKKKVTHLGLYTQWKYSSKVKKKKIKETFPEKNEGIHHHYPAERINRRSLREGNGIGQKLRAT